MYSTRTKGADLAVHCLQCLEVGFLSGVQLSSVYYSVPWYLVIVIDKNLNLQAKHHFS